MQSHTVSTGLLPRLPRKMLDGYVWDLSMKVTVSNERSGGSEHGGGFRNMRIVMVTRRKAATVEEEEIGRVGFPPARRAPSSSSRTNCRAQIALHRPTPAR